MKSNPLLLLESLGQSIWLDYIQRELMASGQLKKLIDEDGLRGMTSNPSLFEQAISKSNDYDADIKSMTVSGHSVDDIYTALTIKDVQDAADIFRNLYNKLDGKDGYVSLEVNPHLAHDTEATIKQARNLWKTLNRPNVFIKVPATKEGIPAIKQLISEGINVNVTLLFGLPRYKEVAEAYIEGLEARLANGAALESVASVASFFLSRIDVLIDPQLEHAKELQGQVAIASAKLAYQIYHELFNSIRFKKLIEQGARVQRLLWASTSTKNPDYSDTKYVEALIGPDTVNTLPLETLNAYRDHGHPQLQLEQDVDKAQLVFKKLSELGIDIDKMTQQLEDEGVDKFNKSFDELMAQIKDKSAKDLK
jgi:transaldolase